MSVISTLPLLTSLSNWPLWNQIFSTNSIKFNSRDSPTQTGNILRPRADRRLSAEYELSVWCILLSSNSCYSFRAINIHLFVSLGVCVLFTFYFRIILTDPRPLSQTVRLLTFPMLPLNIGLNIELPHKILKRSAGKLDSPGQTDQL